MLRPVLARACALLFLLVGLSAPGRAAPARDNFLYEQAGRKVRVWHYAPAGLPADAPVLIVMHGVGRNGEDYLNDWVPAAEAKRFLLVVPEFSKVDFPGEEGYIYGNTVDEAGQPRPRAEWSFGMIEPIFDAVRARLGNTSDTYRLYGHSAGAQFVQRFLYFVPEARVSRAVAANAGWYMLPDLDTAFPYGLKGTPVTAAARDAALARPLTILLGEADTDAQHRSLRHTPEADAQGLHRFARGQSFFRLARDLAARSNRPFHWDLATAPGVAHSNRDMTPFALRVLFPD
jgi:poly(3-hydroxybutyrate) depolymerase